MQYYYICIQLTFTIVAYYDDFFIYTAIQTMKFSKTCGLRDNWTMICGSLACLGMNSAEVGMVNTSCIFHRNHINLQKKKINSNWRDWPVRFNLFYQFSSFLKVSRFLSFDRWICCKQNVCFRLYHNWCQYFSLRGIIYIIFSISILYVICCMQNGCFRAYHYCCQYFSLRGLKSYALYIWASCNTLL